tara:strand:- start:75 stop:359 length:285 start_codon:yes stop_codon:yes gene_type:complete
MDEANKLLFNKKVMYAKKKKVVKVKIKDHIDNNDEILELLKGRLTLGKKRYGHGIRVGEDTDWELMALEEILDGLIYATSSIIRYRNMKIKNEI